MADQPVKKISGGKRLTDTGKKPILIGATEAEHRKLARAAKAERRPITQFLLFHGLAAADQALNK